MPIAHTVQMYLAQNGIAYDVVEHPHSVSSLRTASEACIAPTRLAKAVLLEDDLGHSRFLMAVLPAARHIELARISQQTGRPVHLATEEDAAGLFADCEAGAIPPLGPAYGVETVWDDSLMEQPELYLEAGDHEHLVHLRSADLRRLLRDCPHGQFSRAT
jgi:Ala-tRNA(Pro) deacylase